MYNIIPLVLILLSIGTAIVVVVRKFSVLASLDVDTIRAEKEAVVKEQIISHRLKRNFYAIYNKLLRIIKPIGGAIGSLFTETFKKLKEFKDNYNNPDANFSEKSINKLLMDVDNIDKKEDIAEAEAKYIKIISKDPGNIEAFRGLAKLYKEKKNFSEAKQTLEHALRLTEKQSLGGGSAEIIADSEEAAKLDTKLADMYYDLSFILQSLEDFPGALRAINKALSIIPHNPRYLDTKLEISIINKDKGQAWDALNDLKKVNPENKKLDEFTRLINEL